MIVPNGLLQSHFHEYKKHANNEHRCPLEQREDKSF
jgi:hypothetical protein